MIWRGRGPGRAHTPAREEEHWKPSSAQVGAQGGGWLSFYHAALMLLRSGMRERQVVCLKTM